MTEERDRVRACISKAIDQHTEATHKYVLGYQEPDHFVTFGKESWFIEHSMGCRMAGTLGTCDYNEAADLLANDNDWSPAGRWRFVSLHGDNGFPELERAE